MEIWSGYNLAMITLARSHLASEARPSRTGLSTTWWLCRLTVSPRRELRVFGTAWQGSVSRTGRYR